MPTRRISAIEFSELWDLFSVKQQVTHHFVSLLFTQYFLDCCGLSHINRFLMLSQSDQRQRILCGLATHFSQSGVQVVTAGVYNQSEVSMLCSRWKTHDVILLVELKLQPIEDFLLSKEGRHFTKRYHSTPPTNAAFILKSIVRAPSLNLSRIGMRSLRLSQFFNFYAQQDC
jgi:hypothetical protein